MFQNDIIDPIDLPNFQPNKYSNFYFFDDDTECFYDFIEFNNNLYYKIHVY